MSYYRGTYRSWRSRGWRSSGPSKYSVLSGYFGNAVNEIKNAFLNLGPDALEELLADYGSIHGEAAERYAKNTFPKWKSRAVHLSGQTMERLVELVPPYLSPEQRYGLLTKVLEHNKPSKKQCKTIRIDIKEPSSGFAELDDALRGLLKNDPLAHLPEQVMKAATWLYDDDVTACRAMLAQAENKENELIRTNAKREIELLKKAIASGQIKSASYTVEMPAGKLSVVAYLPSKCFVASVCFGEEAYETQTLRNWRDRFLIRKSFGRKFIVWYYQNGASFAYMVSKLPKAQMILRLTISLLVKVFLSKNYGAQDVK